MTFSPEAELPERGWIRGDDGLRRSPTDESEHVHSRTCTVESCGESATFFCSGDVCLRALRRGEESKTCTGHRLPKREVLTEYSLRKRGITKPSPAGTPLEDEESTTNTWSDER